MKWCTAQLGEVTQIVSGSTPKSGVERYWDGDVAWATPTDLSKLETKHIDATARTITQEGLASCSARILPPQSVLFSSRAPIGLVAINTGPVCTNQGFKSFVPDPERLSADFLFWWLKSHRKALEHLGRGATFKEVSKKIIESVEIPLPPLPEQKRIAAILDAADSLRAKRREALSQLDGLLQATFLDLFGDPVTNPKGWEKKRMEEIFDIARGGSPRPIDKFITTDPDGINWIMIGDTTEGSRYITATKKQIIREGLSKSRMVYPGDFLLTNSMSFGRPYILKVEGCIHDGWLVLSPKSDQVTVDYFYNLLGTDALYREFSRRAAGAVVKNLNTNLVKGVEVALPPLAVQQQFATIVERVEKQKGRHIAHLAELDTLFASLQDRAFTGKL